MGKHSLLKNMDNYNSLCHLRQSLVFIYFSHSQILFHFKKTKETHIHS